VLMRDQNRVQVFGRFANGGQPGQRVALAQTRVDQDLGPIGSDKC
jgi:hypothetical protein